MKFKKGNILESLSVKPKGKKTFSEVPQNIIITESQFEYILENLINEEEKK